MKARLNSPAARLLAGVAVTVAAVAIYSLYTLGQVASLRELQTTTIDRNRRDSLQLLRIQGNLHSLALAMRDMLDGEEPYGLEAWSNQFQRIRADLDDALRLETALAPAGRDPRRQQYLVRSLNLFWNSVDHVFSLVRSGESEQARNMVRTSLQAQQASLTTTVARLLIQNNEYEEQAMLRIQEIYRRVERNIYIFLAAVLAAIVTTSVYMIRSIHRLFERVAVLSGQRSELAQKLITMQEEVLHSISRELHDEFGQTLTAIGAMLSRVEKRGLPPDSPFREDLREVRQVAQATLEKTRSLSQILHPSALDDGGLEKAVDWYLPVFERRTGIAVKYEKSGTSPQVEDRVAIHVYRILQEALNNLARHSKSSDASVRMRFSPTTLELEVEDAGVGIPENGAGKQGIGIVAMRERAELLHGRIQFLRKPEGGTVVRLSVPLTEPA